MFDYCCDVCLYVFSLLCFTFALFVCCFTCCLSTVFCLWVFVLFGLLILLYLVLIVFEGAIN